ncbi:hypothetical protein BDN72DRAFT_848501, partial [Pluteus cervinus]
MSLQLCPPEIVARSLRYLDGHSLIKCRRVCRLFSSLIADDIEIQYIVELYSSGMVDEPRVSPDLSTRERLEKLRELVTWRQSRTQLRENDTTVSLIEAGNGRYQSYSFIRLLDDDRTVGITDLTGVTGKDKPLNSVERQHPIQPRDGTWGRFCSDRDQDLLVVLDGNDLGPVGLRILSLSKGFQHPLAESPNISWENEHLDAEWIDLDIFGDFLSVAYHRVNLDLSTMLVHNWKTGRYLLRSHGHESFVFLDHRYILICIRDESNHCYVHVRELASSTTILKLALPYLPDPRSPTAFHNGALKLPAGVRHHPHYPCRTSPDHAVITLFTLATSSQTTTVIPCSALIDLVDKFIPVNDDSPVMLSWGSWPQVSFLFPADAHQPCLTAAYGHRLAISTATVDSFIRVYEFDKRWIANGLSVVQADESSFTTVIAPRPVLELKVENSFGLDLDEDVLITWRGTGPLIFRI